MAGVRRTAQAERDLIDIWVHIARDREAAADALLDRIESVCVRLADHPRLGPARPDLAPGLRIFPVRRYLILYRVVAGGVEIVRVLRGARDLPGLL